MAVPNPTHALPNDGNSTSNAYGLYWSHQNAGSKGGANNLASHGIIILEAGNYKGSWGGGRIVTTEEVRGTLFRDYNSTAYYVNPAGQSHMNRSDPMNLDGLKSGFETFKSNYKINSMDNMWIKFFKIESDSNFVQS